MNYLSKILAKAGILTSYLQVDTAATGAPAVAGTMSWNEGDGTVDLVLKGGLTTLQVGQELVTMCYNDSGVALTDGQMVYISGAQGNRIAIKLATNAGEVPSTATFGMVTEPIAIGAEGLVTTYGIVRQLNTVGLTEGAPLWLGATAGTYTQTKPIAPANTVLVGYVVRVHATVGSIYVKVANGFELEELHDVYTPAYVNNGLLYRDTATNLWKTAEISTILGYTPANGNIYTTSGTLTSNRIVSLGAYTFAFDKDISINGVTVGKGASSLSLNVAIGLSSLASITTGNQNSGFGSAALFFTTTGIENLGLGYQSARGNTTGNYNIAIGTRSLYAQTTGSHNIGIGRQAGYYITGGVSTNAIATNSIYIGSLTRAFASNQTNEIVIGHGETGLGSNTVIIGNATTTLTALRGNLVLGGVVNAGFMVDVIGTARISGNTTLSSLAGTGSRMVVADSSGVLSTQALTGYVTIAGNETITGTKIFNATINASSGIAVLAGSAVTFWDVLNGASASLSNNGTTAYPRLSTPNRLLVNDVANDDLTSALQVQGDTRITGSLSIKPTGFPVLATLTRDVSGTGFGALELRNGAWATIKSNALAVDRTYILPDASGTFALTSDLSSYVTIAGNNEQISGTKSFNSTINFNNYPIQTQKGIALDYRTGGTSGVGSSTSLGGKIDGLLIALNGGSSYNNLIFANPSISHDYTFPAATGTLALTSDLSSYVPTSRQLTINGTAYDLSADRSWTITPNINATSTQDYTATAGQTIFTVSAGYTVGQLAVFYNGAKLASSEFTATNGTTFTLASASLVNDIVQAVAWVTGGGISLGNLSATGPLAYNAATGVFSIQVANTSQNGYLSSTDWNTFNGKQNALTNPVTGTGTTNYLPKFTGASAIGNSSLINDASGNLGLGVTPSAWSGFTAFDIGSTGNLASYGSGADIQLNANAYFNGSGWLYKTASTAGRFRLGGNEFQWFNAPSGTAGAAITFTQAMTLTSGGNLLLNTTTDAGYKLDVNGTARFSGSTLFNSDLFTYVNGGIFFSGASTFTSGIFQNASGLQLQSGGSPRLTIASTGAATFSSSVSINGANNTSELNIYAASQPRITFQNSGANRAYISADSGNTIYNSLTGNGHQFQVDGSIKVAITGTGNVGIGTSSTGFNVAGLPLVVGSGSGNTGMTIFSGNTFSGSIHFADAETTGSASYSGFINYDHTANSMQFGTNNTERMRITSAGSVGIGTNAPAPHSGGTGLVVKGSARGIIELWDNASGKSVFQNVGGNTYIGQLDKGTGSGDLYLLVGGSGTSADVAMGLKANGNVLINTTTDRSTGKLQIVSSGTMSEWLQQGGNTDTYILFSATGATGIGAITRNPGGGVTYATSSDYRLKHDFKDYSGLDIINKIKTYDFAWNTDSSRNHGVIAHELQAVLPYAVTGLKDGERMQGVDYSKITPINTKAIQELHALVLAQKARIEFLESKI